jgi:threonine dehydrogenase-like Zn-dependent dehydrogenase
MRALRLTDRGLIFDPSAPTPQPLPGEGLIRVRLAGVCATDLALLAGYKGGFRGILGHEFVGEVVAAPDAPEWVGRRVVGEINVGCGSCALCARGLAKHCPQRYAVGIKGKDGAFADLLTLPVANLHAVPDEVRDEQAVFAEPLAAALEVLEQVSIGPTSRVVVIGDGRLGLLISQVVALTGCDLTVIGRHAAKLDLLAQWGCGATALDGSAEAGALAATPIDVVIEATGAPQGFAAARALVRPGGVLVLKSTFAGEMSPRAQMHVDLNSLVVDEVTVIGSRCGPFAPALRLLASGRVQVEPLIQARYALGDGVAAVRYAGQRGVLKVVIAP